MGRPLASNALEVLDLARIRGVLVLASLLVADSRLSMMLSSLPALVLKLLALLLLATKPSRRFLRRMASASNVRAYCGKTA